MSCPTTAQAANKRLPAGSPKKTPPLFSGGVFYDRVCKPGSVIDSHLSRRTVAGALQPPSRKQPGRPCFLCGVAPDRVYSNGRFRTPLGALLPHLSTLTSSTQTSYPSPCCKRQVSVIPLRLLSPQNFRFAGPPFLGRGGISLLHFSSDRSGRALPVILALWSPDFPHSKPFGFAARPPVLLALPIVKDGAGKVKGGERRFAVARQA